MVKVASPQKENGYTAIANEIMEAFNKIRISGEAHQVLGVIIRKTYGFNKKQDQIATTQFIQDTGLPRFAIHKARKKLLDMNIITVTKKGNSQILNYSIQKDYDKWKPLPKKVTVTKKGNGCNQKRLQVSPKKVTNCNQKGDPQKKEIHYTKETITKDNNTVAARDYFYSSYKRVFNKDYVASFGRDGATFKGLLAVIPLEELKGLIDTYLTTPDKFVEEGGYSIGIFRSRINSLRMEKRNPLISDKTLKSGIALKSWIKKGEKEC